MLTLAVQAGGESRRMGSDKGRLPFMHRALILRVIERLAPLADEVIVTTNRPDDYKFLGVPLFRDVVPGRGALGGLYTALQAASHPLVAVVACDMPFASRELFEYEYSLIVEKAVDVVIPSSAEGLEPMHAIFRRATCLPAVQTAVQQNEWKLISWFAQVQVHTLPVAEVNRFDPHGRIFMNVNTPADLELAEEIARGEDQSPDNAGGVIPDQTGK
jgi:molybdopterin-guanine dinucleotide biosynthesis protein A